MREWWAKLRTQGWQVQSAVLGLVVLAVSAFVAPVAGRLGGRAGLMAAMAAAALCFLGAVLALWVSHRVTGGSRQVGLGFVAGMVPRMGVPILGGVFFQLFVEALAKEGFLYYLLLFYPITLAVETALQLPAGQGPK